MKTLASAKATISIHSPTNSGIWRQALCLLTLATLSLTISSCGGGNDSPQTSRQIVAQLIHQGYLKAANTDANDVFGYSLALAGDTLVVGAPGEASAAIGVNGNQGDNSAPGSGSVYVFTRTGSNWSQQAYLKASNTEAGDGFGGSLALAGDTLAVGATGEASAATGVDGDETDNSAVESGAVYVFTRSNGVWSQQAYVKASNTESLDWFGYSVALAGDTLAVGAAGEASASGAVYVFTRTGNVWSQQAYVKASNTEANDGFGESVALAGDTLAVGATGEASAATGINNVTPGDGDNSAPESGAVYVFTRTGSAWSQQAYVKASNTEGLDWFGYSVALAGDTLAVGALFEASNATGINGTQGNNFAPESGAVYVFTRTGSAWSQQAYVKASNTEANDGFGESVSLANDTLAVGAAGEDSATTGINGNQGDNSAPDSGAAYVFTRTGSAWGQQAYVKASNTEGFDLFGSSIALADDTLIVGSFFEASAATGVNGTQGDNSAPDSGAAYVFSLQ